ncbi:AP2 domain-containing protein [Bacillus benzoevorans]|uniref:AP2/ERF domain-containing protein n=1 Tax=Bacillus benzoevorans TaxID=1456 RepID=A0A7X0HTG0_9BACI|nr:AP2 domain-containing protein [Bacillus benzoevorans]MBB6446493.1 hypothetical protein [Bacillus benzoevorans]
MAKRMNLAGEIFGRLTVLEFDSMKDTNSYWRCKCECGNVTVVAGNSLKRGVSKSCGCLQKEKTSNANFKHGHTAKNSPEYRSWRSMITRCEDESVNNYERYGGRGIKVCKRWRNSFESFLSDMGKRPTLSYTLDRIDVNGNYEPSNCRWADLTQQAINKRLQKNNNTGVRGVHWSKRERKFKAQIKYRGKFSHLGTFDTLEEAAKARKEAEIKYWGMD